LGVDDGNGGECHQNQEGKQCWHAKNAGKLASYGKFFLVNATPSSCVGVGWVPAGPVEKTLKLQLRLLLLLLLPPPPRLMLLPRRTSIPLFFLLNLWAYQTRQAVAWARQRGTVQLQKHAGIIACSRRASRITLYRGAAASAIAPTTPHRRAHPPLLENVTDVYSENLKPPSQIWFQCRAPSQIEVPLPAQSPTTFD
jgi:hypothetical protein